MKIREKSRYESNGFYILKIRLLHSFFNKNASDKNAKNKTISQYVEPIRGGEDVKSTANAKVRELKFRKK